MPVHFRYETQFIKTRLFENPPRSGIVGVGKCSDFSKSQLIASDLEAKSGQFGCVAIPPYWRDKVIADLGTPTGVERIITETSKSDDLTILFAEYARWAVADLPPLAFVSCDVTSTGRQIGEFERIPHGPGVTEKLEESGAIGQTRPAKYQSLSFQAHAENLSPQRAFLSTPPGAPVLIQSEPIGHQCLAGSRSAWRCAISSSVSLAS